MTFDCISRLEWIEKGSPSHGPEARGAINRLRMAVGGRKGVTFGEISSCKAVNTIDRRRKGSQLRRVEPEGPCAGVDGDLRFCTRTFNN
jgi:hypothetical protein